MVSLTREVVVYFLYPDVTNPQEVLYLQKDRPNRSRIHGKLVGLGGRVETGETIDEAARREIGEEVAKLGNGCLLDNYQLYQQGILRVLNERRQVYVFKSELGGAEKDKLVGKLGNE